MQWNELAVFQLGAPTRAHVLVSMVGKRGSSYRQPGARMLVREDGAFSGGVSAGCLEDEIARAAAPVLKSGVPRLLSIDTRPHYGCPGEITILLEPLSPEYCDDFFSLVRECIAARSPFTVATRFTGLQGVLPLTRITGAEEEPVQSEGGILLEHVGRRPRIIAVGDGDDATAVSKVAALAGWQTHVVAPESVRLNAGKLTRDFSPDDRTAVVLLTHNLGLDVSCLNAVLPLPYSYVGVIGSQRRRTELVEGLESSGGMESLACLDRLHCPAGLDIGSADASEIAISILAEIQCLWSGRDAAPLRERTAPIHQSERTV